MVKNKNNVIANIQFNNTIICNENMMSLLDLSGKYRLVQNNNKSFIIHKIEEYTPGIIDWNSLKEDYIETSSESKYELINAKLSKPIIKVKANKNKIKISYKKVQNAQKYKIYRSNKKGGKYKKICITKKTSFLDKKVKKNKKYYYKVKAFSKILNNNLTSNYSKVKVIKAK